MVAARSIASAKRRRRRLALAGVAGAIAFAAMTPTALDPAQRELGALASADGVAGLRCQHAGASGAPALCDRAMVLHRPVAWR